VSLLSRLALASAIATLATLKKVEARFAGQPVVVIGIHSPKFDAEGESARLASTLDAYDLHHPVAVDGKRALWDRWGAEAVLSCLQHVVVPAGRVWRGVFGIFATGVGALGGADARIRAARSSRRASQGAPCGVGGAKR